MFSPKLKERIAYQVQQLLAETNNPELPTVDNIKFLLHVDGEEGWSWANIRDNESNGVPVPKALIGNENYDYGGEKK